MPRLPLVIACLLVASSSRADDLPAAVVARPATLPDGMIAVQVDAGYERARVLGITVLRDTDLFLSGRWGVTSRFEVALETSFVANPDARWSQEGVAQLTYRAWQRGSLELAPLMTVPLSIHSGADVTSTIALGANLRWRASERVLVVAGQRLLPVAVRPAAALDIGLDGGVAVQLAARWAGLAQVAAGELTIVGQFDRSVAPWHHLTSSAGLLYATEHRLDVTLALQTDVLHPRDRFGVALAVTRRL